MTSSNDQAIDESSYHVQSSDKEVKYSVFVLIRECLERQKCVPQCSQQECEYLCQHMYKCTCMDCVHGHYASTYTRYEQSVQYTGQTHINHT